VAGWAAIVTSKRPTGLRTGLRWVQRTDTTAPDAGGAGTRAMIATAVSSASREERLRGHRPLPQDGSYSYTPTY
jgi:hypothetical protein